MKPSCHLAEALFINLFRALATRSLSPPSWGSTQPHDNPAPTSILNEVANLLLCQVMLLVPPRNVRRSGG